jgi:hypothetical protein
MIYKRREEVYHESTQKLLWSLILYNENQFPPYLIVTEEILL